MLNLLPLRNPANSLLYGKTGLQRIRVGKHSKVIEVDTSSIDEIYSHSRDDVTLHNNFVPLKHKNFMEYKLVAYHLIEAFEKPERSFKTTLGGIAFFDKLKNLYSKKMLQTEVDALLNTKESSTSFPIQGKNI
ncbi:hypothetical protein TpMuguga_02g00722 [Theileria parva strain Muguga]|uniref:Uncharacterized protein n=1 Tax=Theileria parva TaxID=5875 RepID=Q4N4B7_THEPA|nr:uncharacterized protein TpMuguga_02g00722 [Theileria parva strain Muguga]EAN33006.1 hypothetical protein TpMuguga_02g00722 [Theileria parva strain Muguga]|eukprot:XP_765289.1 hypothetical protein [Theileria parva strain Muguga]